MYARAKTFTLARPRLKKTLGVIFLVVGTLGLVLPVIPGALLLFIGLELLGLKLLFLDKLLKRERPVQTN